MKTNFSLRTKKIIAMEFIILNSALVFIGTIYLVLIIMNSYNISVNNNCVQRIKENKKKLFEFNLTTKSDSNLLQLYNS